MGLRIMATITYQQGQGRYKLWSPILRTRLEAGQWIQEQSGQYDVIESQIHEITETYAKILEGLLFPLDIS